MASPKEKFTAKIASLQTKDRSTISRDKYEEDLARLLLLDSDHSVRKSMSDYNLCRKYEVQKIASDVNALVKKGTRLRFICVEVNVCLHFILLHCFACEHLTQDLYDSIDAEHISSGHSGRNILTARLNSKFANITKEHVQEYLALCEACQLKKPAYRRGIVVKPILSDQMNARAQVRFQFTFISAYNC